MSKIEKLELRHIAGYFPYGLKGVIKDKIVSLRLLHKNSLETSPSVYRFTYCSFPDFNPILRNLSDLNKEIEHNGDRFVPCERLKCFAQCEMDQHWIVQAHYSGALNWLMAPYHLTCKLMEWHFDIYGLIDSGLAVDINTVKA